MDIQGVRRLRMTSQLIFESVPQLLLQFYIYMAGYAKDLEITETSLIVSFVAALLHIVCESALIWMEARACKASLLYFLLLTLNGRIAWVPFIEQFLIPGNHELYDYGDLTFRKKYCCLSMKVPFIFNEMTVEKLTETIAKMAPKDETRERIIIQLGSSAENIGFIELVRLIQVSYRRLSLITNDLDWTKAWQLSASELTAFNRTKTVFADSKETLMYALCKVGCLEGVFFLLDKLRINPTIIIHDKDDDTPLWAALENDHIEIYRMLLFAGAKNSLLKDYTDPLRYIVRLRRYEFLLIYLEDPSINFPDDLRKEILDLAIDMWSAKPDASAKKIIYWLGGYESRILGKTI
jgi:hypothetical protein